MKEAKFNLIHTVFKRIIQQTLYKRQYSVF